MTTKECLHRLVDELSEKEADDALEYLAARHESKDRPGDIIDKWGNLSAMTRVAGRRMLHRLDEEEMAEHGETIAQAFARAQRENAQ